MHFRGVRNHLGNKQQDLVFTKHFSMSYILKVGIVSDMPAKSCQSSLVRACIRASRGEPLVVQNNKDKNHVGVA